MQRNALLNYVLSSSFLFTLKVDLELMALHIQMVLTYNTVLCYVPNVII